MRQAFQPFQAVPAWKDHLKANTSFKARLDAVFGTAGLDAWASWCVWFFIKCLVSSTHPCVFFPQNNQTTTFSTH
ncbi:hypothetical protein F5888DRAFT_1736842 [Russula emetica]|nr:hypothetical protein F5888DRAFT_1736842 [Russula emetica]